MGGCPYPGINSADLFRLLHQGYRMDPAPLCPPDVDAIVRRCWAAAPEDRPDFAELARELSIVEEKVAQQPLRERMEIENDDGYTEFSHVPDDRLQYASIEFRPGAIGAHAGARMTTEEGMQAGRDGQATKRSSTTSFGTSGYGSGEHASFESLDA